MAVVVVLRQTLVVLDQRVMELPLLGLLFLVRLDRVGKIEGVVLFLVTVARFSLRNKRRLVVVAVAAGPLIQTHPIPVLVKQVRQDLYLWLFKEKL
jgi:hypothetical protein